jgi:mannose/fructose/N-acetylgalactosamine-specific phosphotransferase system component IIC
MSPFILLSLIAGFLAVDDRAGWQSLLAQPVFAALLVGLVTGQVVVALPVGLMLELIWLSILPMRGSRRPDQVLGAVTGAGSASLLVGLAGDPRILLVSAVGVLIGLLAGEIGGRVSDALLRVLNRFLSHVKFAGKSSRHATVGKLSLLHAGSVAYIFAAEAVAVFVFLTVGFNVGDWFTARVGGPFAEGAVRWGSLIPALGAAAVIQIYWRQHLKRVLILSSVMVLLVLWLR